MDDMTLDMDVETVRSQGYRIVDMVASELSDPSNRPTRPPTQSDDMLAMFEGPLPHKGTDPNELLSIIGHHLIPATTKLLHPCWMGEMLGFGRDAAGNITTFRRGNGYSDLLSDVFTVIMFDARGYGYSDKPHQPEAYDYRLMTSGRTGVCYKMLGP